MEHNKVEDVSGGGHGSWQLKSEYTVPNNVLDQAVTNKMLDRLEYINTFAVSGAVVVLNGIAMKRKPTLTCDRLNQMSKK